MIRVFKCFFLKFENLALFSQYYYYYYNQCFQYNIFCHQYNKILSRNFQNHHFYLNQIKRTSYLQIIYLNLLYLLNRSRLLPIHHNNHHHSFMICNFIMWHHLLLLHCNPHLNQNLHFTKVIPNLFCQSSHRLTYLNIFTNYIYDFILLI